MTNNISAEKFVESFNYFYLIFVPSNKADADAYVENIVEFNTALSSCGKHMLKRVQQELSVVDNKSGTYLLIPMVGRIIAKHMPNSNSFRYPEMCASGVICTEHGIVKGAQEGRKIKWSVVSAGEANKVSGSTTPYLRMISIAEDTNECKY
jgi:hypothetical protein